MAIGRVRTSFGIRGDVKVTSYSGEFDHFARLTSVSIRQGSHSRLYEVSSTRWSGDVFLMKLSGVDSPEAAKLLADSEIWVPRSQAAPLESGEVYLGDLIGCSLLWNGQVKGTVTGYWEGAAAPLLEVETSDGQKAMVPFQDVYLGDIDLSGRTIELRVDWILS